MKITWKFFLNFFILQWFFIRLAEVNYDKEDYDTYYGVHEMEPPKYKILKWIVPLTGWWGNYIWIRRKDVTKTN